MMSFFCIFLERTELSMKKRLSGKKLLSLALAVLAVTSLLATATFVKAFASDDVSPTDTTQQTAPEEIPEDTQEDIPEDIQEIQPEEITESAEEPADHPQGIRDQIETSTLFRQGTLS